jgi:hypothetical protein
MTANSRVEYEAIGSAVYAEKSFGLLVIEVATAEGAQVALNMRQSTLEALYEQITKAHDDLKKRSQAR